MRDNRLLREQQYEERRVRDDKPNAYPNPNQSRPLP